MGKFVWTEEKEQAYQEKLANKPRMGKFHPDKLPAHEQATTEWYRTLTPEEKLRYGVDRPAII